jgi:hypothetical protein
MNQHEQVAVTATKYLHGATSQKTAFFTTTVICPKTRNSILSLVVSKFKIRIQNPCGHTNVAELVENILTFHSLQLVFRNVGSGAFLLPAMRQIKAILKSYPVTIR